MASFITSPYPVFFDTDGTPLENGFIYIGTANLNPVTSPINVFWDEALTQPAAQPIRTLNGYASRNGTPSQIYTALTNFSMLVKNRNEVQVYYAQDATIGAVFNGYPISSDQIGVLSSSNLPALSSSQIPVLPATQISFIQAGTGAVSRTAEAKMREAVSVKDFGATGDGTTDDTAAIQLAIDAFNAVRATSPATLMFPAGKYRVTGSLNFTLPASGNQRGEVIGGDGTYEVATIIADYGGNNADPVFKIGDIMAPASQAGISMYGFRFDKAAQQYQPIAILGSRIAQSRLANIVVGEWNNTFLSLATPQNCRFENLTFFGCGKTWLYKDTTGITATQATTTVTASAPIFSANDVGHYISIWGPGPSFSRRKMLITAFTSMTVVTVDFSFTDAVQKSLYFDQPLVSMTAGTSTLYADTSCFSSNDIGAFVYVKGAGAGGRLLRGKITAQSGNTATLDVTALTTVTNVEFGNAAVEVYTDVTAQNGGSDNSFVNLQVESHGGIGFISKDNDLLAFSNAKLHSEQTPVQTIPSRFSLAPIWIDQTDGYYNGGFQGQYLGKSKIYATYQTSSFVFQSLSFRTAYNENIIECGLRASGFDGGLVQFDGIALAKAFSGKTVDELCIDANTSPKGYLFTGKVSFNDYNLTRAYAGNEGTFGWGAVTASTITWSGTPPTIPTPGGLSYKWQRIGYIVFYEFRLEYTVAGALNLGVSIAKQADMPDPYYAEPSPVAGEFISPCKGFIDTGATAVPSSLCNSYTTYSSTSGINFNTALNSGSINALIACINGFYFTK
jgi:hypothetical protein